MNIIYGKHATATWANLFGGKWTGGNNPANENQKVKEEVGPETGIPEASSRPEREFPWLTEKNIRAAWQSVQRILMSEGVAQKGRPFWQSLLHRFEADAPIRVASRRELDQVSPSPQHQGIILEMAAEWQPPNLAETNAPVNGWLDSLPDERPFLLALDRIQDPHNLGAILRTAEALGVTGVLISAAFASGLSPAVHHISTGASLLLPLKPARNLPRILSQAATAGYQVLVADMAGAPLDDFHGFPDSDTPAGQTNIREKTILVVGSEGYGVSPQVRRAGYSGIQIPMSGFTRSLNASVSAGILISHLQYLKRKP